MFTGAVRELAMRWRKLFELNVPDAGSWYVNQYYLYCSESRSRPKLAFMDGQIVRKERLLNRPSSERRASIRFPLNLEVRFSVVGHRGRDANGSGRTTDLSSSGLGFTADIPLSIGQKLDLSIDWPVRLDGQVQLQLVLSGVVVRTTGTVTALRIVRHEFRTQRAALRGRATA